MSTNARVSAAKDQQRTYQGRACQQCGGTERYTSSGQCVPCTKERAATHTENIRALLRGENDSD